jgi:hypothetical protein
MESEGNSSIIHILGALGASTTPGFNPHIFDGTPQETTGYNSVRVLCSANRNGIINFMHSMDNIHWDVTQSINYPGSGLSIGQPLYVVRALQTKWYKTQFINNDSVSCALRLSTMLHNEPDLSGVQATINSVNATLWNAYRVSPEDMTDGLDISSVRTIDVFGRADPLQPCEIEIEYSGDNYNYYTSNGSILISTSCNFHANINDVGAKYIRFRYRSTDTCLITLVVNGK